MTPEERTALGCQLYNRLAMVTQSYRDWFAEGVPSEWVRALDAIQQTLTQCKREAAQAARARRAGQGELFREREASTRADPAARMP